MIFEVKKVVSYRKIIDSYFCVEAQMSADLRQFMINQSFIPHAYCIFDLPIDSYQFNQIFLWELRFNELYKKFVKSLSSVEI